MFILCSKTNYRFDEMMTHVHVPKKSINKVRNTLTLTKMRHRGRVAPTIRNIRNIRNNRRRNNRSRSRSRSRIRNFNNSSLDNL